MSSHLVSDLERVCDYVIVLVASHLQVAGVVTELLASHRELVGKTGDLASLPADWQVITTSRTGRQSTLLVRTGQPVQQSAWSLGPVGLEDLVLAYMSRAAGPVDQPEMEVRR
jgi:ABC-2 type transport system ATP-binding protein